MKKHKTSYFLTVGAVIVLLILGVSYIIFVLRESHPPYDSIVEKIRGSKDIIFVETAEIESKMFPNARIHYQKAGEEYHNHGNGGDYYSEYIKVDSLSYKFKFDGVTKLLANKLVVNNLILYQNSNWGQGVQLYVNEKNYLYEKDMRVEEFALLCPDVWKKVKKMSIAILYLR